MAAYVDGAQALILDQASNLAGIGAMLDKIDVFVNIIDKTASVRGRICTRTFLAK
jgi:hypothetical protein